MAKRVKGSQKGQISRLELAWVVLRRWLYWMATGLSIFVGTVAEYVRENWSSVQMALPWYFAAALFGVIGVILASRDARKIKESDTRPPEERNK